tara:strand:- start:472 stop:900 length:429 start_codon:yes stop_codon:yes gene_type:complete
MEPQLQPLLAYVYRCHDQIVDHCSQRDSSTRSSSRLTAAGAGSAVGARGAATAHLSSAGADGSPQGRFRPLVDRKIRAVRGNASSEKRLRTPPEPRAPVLPEELRGGAKLAPEAAEQLAAHSRAAQPLVGRRPNLHQRLEGI